MYDLLQGVQSGMLKLDPLYLNRAVIEKRKGLSSRWQRSSSFAHFARLSQQQQSSLHQRPVTDMSLEVQLGLQEMVDLDRILKERAHQTSQGSIIARDSSRLSKQIIVKVNRDSSMVSCAIASQPNLAVLLESGRDSRSGTQYIPVQPGESTKISHDGNTTRNEVFLDHSTPVKNAAD